MNPNDVCEVVVKPEVYAALVKTKPFELHRAYQNGFRDGAMQLDIRGCLTRALASLEEQIAIYDRAIAAIEGNPDLFPHKT